MAIKLRVADPQPVKMIVGGSDAVGLKVEAEIIIKKTKENNAHGN